jgi:hypothetical protein
MTYLSIGHSAVSITVHLVNQMLSISVSDAEPSAVDESAELVLCDHAIAIKVASQECVV